MHCRGRREADQLTKAGAADLSWLSSGAAGASQSCRAWACSGRRLPARDCAGRRDTRRLGVGAQPSGRHSGGSLRGAARDRRITCPLLRHGSARSRCRSRGNRRGEARRSLTLRRSLALARADLCRFRTELATRSPVTRQSRGLSNRPRTPTHADTSDTTFRSAGTDRVRSRSPGSALSCRASPRALRSHPCLRGVPKGGRRRASLVRRNFEQGVLTPGRGEQRPHRL